MVSSSPMMINVVQVSKVSPPPSTLQKSLALSFFDMAWLLRPPIHHVFFYEIPGLTRTHFINTILPKFNHSLSTTLQHFFPYAGNLIIYHTPTKIPEICYVQGDHVNVTYSECNLDFNHLTGNHPRNCDKFYHLIPPLGECVKMSDHTKIPVFSVQLTLFPDHGISIGLTNHHSVGDASTQLGFLKAWTLISQCGTDELFLARKTLPCYDRLICDPAQEEEILKRSNVESWNQKEVYQPPHLSGPSDKVRATFIMTRNMVNRLKKLVSTQLPTVTYVSSFTVSCAYIWSCLVKSCNIEIEVLIFAVECRARMDPPIPPTYFGNCLMPCLNISTTTDLLKHDGFVAIAKLIGENIRKMLTTEGGIRMAKAPFSEVKSRTMIGIAGSPRMDFYDMNFGWGNPKKQEVVSIDYGGSISMNACKGSKEDLEFGICLSATEMQAFSRIFNNGLEDEV